MVDFAMDVHKSLYPDQEVPATLKDKRSQVVENFKKLQAETEPVLKIFADPEVTRQIQQSRDSKQLLDFLMKGYNFKTEMIDTCYNFAKFQYECGNYSGASEYLYFHRILVQPTDKNYLNGMWGKLAAEILMQNWDTALEDLNRLKTFIDESTFGSNLQTLQQRTWLIHWSLFVFFNHPKGRDLIIDLFLYQKPYLNAIQTTWPWILRYLATAVITNKSSRRNVMKDLIKVIQEESYTYTSTLADPDNPSADPSHSPTEPENKYPSPYLPPTPKPSPPPPPREPPSPGGAISYNPSPTVRRPLTSTGPSRRRI